MESNRFDGIIIVSDMDGTFLGERARVLDNNIEAIEYFKANGGRFTFATGRTHHNVSKALNSRVSEVINAPAITVNGACIYDFCLARPILENKIDIEDARNLIKYAREKFPDVGIRCSTDYGFLTDMMSDIIKRDFDSFIAGGNLGEVKIKELSLWNDENIMKIVFRGDAEELKNVRREIEAEFSDSFTFASSSPYFLELNAKNCSKALGVKYLRELYSTSEKKAIVYCVGDYENDIEMLKEADFAACPDNAMDSVKAISDIFLCHHKDGAIADLIYKL